MLRQHLDPMAHAWLGLRPFPWNPLVCSVQQSSACGYAQMHSLHRSKILSTGGCCFSSLLELVITSLHHAAFRLLFFLLSSFFFVCRLLPVPLHAQFPLIFSCLIYSFTSVSSSLSRTCPLQTAPLNTGEAAQPLVSVGVFLPTVYRK